MTLGRRFAEPRCGLYFVPRYTETAAIHDGNVQLRYGRVFAIAAASIIITVCAKPWVAAKPNHYTFFRPSLNAHPSAADKSHRQLRVSHRRPMPVRAKSPPPSRNSRIRRRIFRHRTRTHRRCRATAASSQISAVLSDYASREYRAKMLENYFPTRHPSNQYRLIFMQRIGALYKASCRFFGAR